MRTQFVLRYYYRDNECVSYPFGHCKAGNGDDLYKYKEDCDKACSPGGGRREAETTTTTAPRTTQAATRSNTPATQPTACIQNRADATSSSFISGGFVPECDANGEFKPLQCHQTTGQCFCVDSQGIEIPNSLQHHIKHNRIVTILQVQQVLKTQ